MFRDIILGLTQWEEAENIYNNVGCYASNKYNCNSMTALLRALLINRVSDSLPSPNVNFCTSSSLSESNTVERNARNTMYNMAYCYNDKNYLQVISCGCGLFVDCKDTILEKINSTGAKFIEVEKVRIFFKKVMNVLCFINPENKSSIVIFEDKGIEYFHYLLSGIPVFIPWFFQGENAVTESDTRLLSTLTKRTPEEFLRELDRVADENDIKAKRLTLYLNNFEKSFAEKRINTVQSDINRIMRDIESYKNMLSDLIGQKKEKDLLLLGLNSKLNNTESKVLDYFRSNPNIELIRVRDGKLQFVSFGHIECFNEEFAETSIENRDSIIYDYSTMSNDDTYRVFSAIFVDNKIKIKTIACYEVDILRNNVRGLSNFSYPKKFDTYLPNTHIDEYSCLGDYEVMMHEALIKEDIIMCIELCIMSSKSINLGDSPVMRKFIPRITNGYKCLELPDGTVTTFEGALKYLEEES